MNEQNKDKILLTVTEAAERLGIGTTKMREIFRNYDKEFVIHIGNRSYAHKEKFERWIDRRISIERSICGRKEK